MIHEREVAKLLNHSRLEIMFFGPAFRFKARIGPYFGFASNDR